MLCLISQSKNDLSLRGHSLPSVLHCPQEVLPTDLKVTGKKPFEIEISSEPWFCYTGVGL